jgi:hypothetical protein
MIKLETTGKHALICTGESGSGSVTGPKTVTMGLTLTGCSDGGESCRNTAVEGTVKFPLMRV